jgi:formylglycine-generating enzyme required for sulfatase activity
MFEQFIAGWPEVSDPVKKVVASIACSWIAGQLPAISKFQKPEEQKRFQKGIEHGLFGFLVCLDETADPKRVRRLLKSQKLRGLLFRVLRYRHATLTHSERMEIFGELEMDPERLTEQNVAGAFSAFGRCFSESVEEKADPLVRLTYWRVLDLFKKSEPATDADTIKELVRTYLDYLNDDFKRLPIQGLTEKELIAIDLQDIFTHLTFEDKSNHSVPEEAVCNINGRPKEAIHDRADASPATLNDVLKSKFAVITGGPGAGKTTLLRFLALNINDYFKEMDDPFLPIIFPISSYSKQRQKTTVRGFNLAEFLKDFYQERHLPDLTLLFQDAWARGRAVFLLDGLDEVSDDAERMRMIDDIGSFMRTENRMQNRFYITCRTASYKGAGRFKPICDIPVDHFEIQPFDDNQIQHYLRQWYLYIEKELLQRTGDVASTATRKARGLFKRIDKNQHIKAMAVNPLMLTIIAIIEFEGGSLPDTRAELYGRCLNLFTGAWDKLRCLWQGEREGFSLGETPINEAMVIKYLGPIAEEMHARASRNIRQSSLKKSLQGAFAAIHDEDQALARADDFLDIMSYRSGLLQKTDSGEYEFVHQTFREYLIARLIKYHNRDPLSVFAGKLFESEWREVIRLTAAVLDQGPALKFISHLLRLDQNQTEALMLAADCGIDIGRKKMDDELSILLDKVLLETARGDTNVASRVQVAEALGRLGDPRNLKECVFIEPGLYDLEEIGEQEVDDFEIGRYPVNNMWFREFVEDGGYLDESYWSEGGLQWLKFSRDQQPLFFDTDRYNCPNSPVVGVCWWEADAFCRWLTHNNKQGWTYRLPTDIQWQAAAAGRKKRKYPWVNEAAGNGNFRETKIKRTSPVGIFIEGSTPDTNIHDLAGNVWEWTCTDFHQKKNRRDFPFNRKLHALYEKEDWGNIMKVLEDKKSILPSLRGGCWDNVRFLARCAGRGRGRPGGRFSFVGFRCVRT